MYHSACYEESSTLTFNQVNRAGPSPVGATILEDECATKQDIMA